MASFVDSVIVLPRPVTAADVLGVLDDYFRENGASVHPDTSVVFNDFEGREREPEMVGSPDELREAVLSWPGSGGAEYAVPGCPLTVFLHGAGAHQVDFVTLSVRDRLHSSDPQARRTFDRVTEELHGRLGAARTLSGFELLSPGSWVAEEVERVRRGAFEGEYARDLR